MSGRLRWLAAAVIVAVVSILSACSQTPAAESEERAEDLPELARVAGAQDLWAFPFSLSATRADVQAAYGAPLRRGSDASRGGTAASIIEWEYEDAVLSFFARNDGSEEYLVSASITGPAAPLNGPVRIGTAVESVREVFGEPRVASDERLVYFFSHTTVEFAVENGRVAAVTLARALP